MISIHALLTESDAGSVRGISSGIAISIHALLTESDPAIDVFLAVWAVILYPRSPYGERRIIDIINNIIDDFYPRSPYGERLSR